MPARYNSSRAKCIKCRLCGVFFSPNKVRQPDSTQPSVIQKSLSLFKFVFHAHRVGDADRYVQPDAANFNSWRRHIRLLGEPPDEIVFAWEDVKVGRHRLADCEKQLQCRKGFLWLLKISKITSKMIQDHDILKPRIARPRFRNAGRRSRIFLLGHMCTLNKKFAAQETRLTN